MEWLDLKYQMLRKYGSLLATSVSSSFCVQLPWAQLEDTGIDGLWCDNSSVLLFLHSCKTYKLIILFTAKQIFKLGLEDKPNKCESCLKLDPTTAASCLQMPKVTLFYVADMRQPRAGLIADFHMAKVFLWKGHQKEKIKTFRPAWKEKEAIAWSRSGFRETARLSPSLALAEDFAPDPFTLHPFPVLSKQLCLFAVVPHLFVVVLLFFSTPR